MLSRGHTCCRRVGPAPTRDEMASDPVYHCRICAPHVRSECIRRAPLTPGEKRIIERAFETHQDTRSTWAVLQSYCLLRQRASRQSGLLTHLGSPEVEQPLEGAVNHRSQPPIIGPAAPTMEGPTPLPEGGPVTQEEDRSILPMPEEPPTLAQRSSTSAPDIGRAESEPPSGEPICYPPAIRSQPEPFPVPGPRILVTRSTGHRILLPEDGELTLGRLDPITQVRPDVDLTYADRLDPGISRMHASVSGWQGRYRIADLGSRNGTSVNGKRLELGEWRALGVGDEVRLGQCVLYFDHLPPFHRTLPPMARYFLYLTFSGRIYPLPAEGNVVIGRADPMLGFTPDIDLGGEVGANILVSRRHTLLVCDGHRFHAEDLGSAFKTKVNGRPVYVGTRIPIRPGEHLWVGGYVLALDLVEGGTKL
jgi:pSer/pThr/pTyr-binding forkhead associated (FHA) protein